MRNDYVAIRKVRRMDMELEAETTMLQSIHSKFIRQYIDCEKHYDQYWVYLCAMDEVVGCTGVLSLRITLSVHQEWKRVESG